MKIIREKTVAFTGNRTLATSDGRDDANLENVIRTELSINLEECYKEGKNCFISGGAWGFDIIAAEEVIKLKTKHSDIILIVAIPFIGQEVKFSEKDKRCYQRVCDAADHTELITNGGFDNDAYHKRNDWMIDNCSEMIAYDSGSKIRSGTTSTIRKARSKGLLVTNLFEEFCDYFQISHPVKKCLQRYPYVTSFKYTRQGIIFDQINPPHFLNFGQIKSVTEQCGFLEFVLQNNVTYKSLLFSDECLVILDKMPPVS